MKWGIANTKAYIENSGNGILTTTTDATLNNSVYELALSYLSETPKVNDYVAYVENNIIEALYKVSAVDSTKATLTKEGNVNENIFMQSFYPIVNKSNDGLNNNKRGWTGSFQPIEPGTYKVILEDYDLVGNGYKWAVCNASKNQYNVDLSGSYSYVTYWSGYITDSNETTFTINENQYFGFYCGKQNETSFSASDLNNAVKIKLIKQ